MDGYKVIVNRSTVAVGTGTLVRQAIVQVKDVHLDVIRNFKWNEYRLPDFGRMRKLLAMPVIIDGRNQYDLRKLAAQGFIYHGIGRPRPEFA